MGGYDCTTSSTEIPGDWVADGLIQAIRDNGINSQSIIGGVLGDWQNWTCQCNATIALRCCHLNGRFEDYWETRRAA